MTDPRPHETHRRSTVCHTGTAAQLLEIVRSNGIDVGSIPLPASPYSVPACRGSVAEYAVGADYGMAQRWFVITGRAPRSS